MDPTAALDHNGEAWLPSEQPSHLETGVTFRGENEEADAEFVPKQSLNDTMRDSVTSVQSLKATQGTESKLLYPRSMDETRDVDAIKRAASSDDAIGTGTTDTQSSTPTLRTMPSESTSAIIEQYFHNHGRLSSLPRISEDTEPPETRSVSCPRNSTNTKHVQPGPHKRVPRINSSTPTSTCPTNSATFFNQDSPTTLPMLSQTPEPSKEKEQPPSKFTLQNLSSRLFKHAPYPPHPPLTSNTDNNIPSSFLPPRNSITNDTSPPTHLSPPHTHPFLHPMTSLHSHPPTHFNITPTYPLLPNNRLHPLGRIPNTDRSLTSTPQRTNTPASESRAGATSPIYALNRSRSGTWIRWKRGERDGAWTPVGVIGENGESRAFRVRKRDVWLGRVERGVKWVACDLRLGKKGIEEIL